MPINVGEFVDPTHPEANRRARTIFVELVERLAPQVFGELRSAVLPVYRRARPLLALPFYEGERVVGGWSTLKSPFRVTFLGVDQPETPASTELVAALERWASKYHLAESWVFDRALTALDTWNWEEPSSTAGLRIRMGLFPVPRAVPAVEMHVPGWDPTAETRVNYQRRVQRILVDKLRQHISAAEAEAAANGWRHVAGRQSGDATLERRLRLLVRWQVQGWPYPAIAKESKMVAPNIRTELVLAANQIGLSLRVGPIGRPRKDTRKR